MLVSYLYVILVKICFWNRPWTSVFAFLRVFGRRYELHVVVSRATSHGTSRGTSHGMSHRTPKNVHHSEGDLLGISSVFPLTGWVACCIPVYSLGGDNNMGGRRDEID